jgi:hypothetical protein
LGFCWALAMEQKQVKKAAIRASAQMVLVFFPLVFIRTLLFFTFHFADAELTEFQKTKKPGVTIFEPGFWNLFPPRPLLNVANS